MKKILTFLLVLTFAFMLSACGEDMPMDMGSKNNSGTVASETRLTEDEALDIALKEANATKDDISGLRIKLDRDDGIEIYEIDFYVGQQEYEYDIHAANGTVLERDRDND